MQHDTAATPDPALPDDYIYTLTDIGTGSPIWSRQQATDERPPERVWLHDTGWVAVGTAADDLLLLHAYDGAVHHSFHIPHALTPDERDRMRFSLYGYEWGFASGFRFEDVDGTLVFVIRTDRGSRIVTDVVRGVRVTDPAMDDALRERESERALAILERASADPAILGGDTESPLATDAYRAALVASQNGCTRAIPSLQRLETVEGSDTPNETMPVRDPRIARGTVRVIGFRELPFREVMQSALRSLGESPTSGAGSYLLGEWRNGSLRLVASTPPGTRHERRHLITHGSSILDVVEAIGPPDERGRSHPTFEV
ncbi:MAG: hypothetical protein AAGH64_10820 [Planctomycetota bacterium]